MCTETCCDELDLDGEGSHHSTRQLADGDLLDGNRGQANTRQANIPVCSFAAL
jgi:hypothetical protein